MKKILIALLIALGFSIGITASIALAATATFRVVETPTYHLYSGESGSAVSVRITPYPTDLDGVKLTMTDFGSSPTVTMDPGFKGIEEIESFTGITDNGDNTATLTGLTRDLASKYPYTTAGTGRTHGSGAIVVFGNNPQIYGRLWAPENDATSTATLAFSSTTPPHLDMEPANWALLNPEAFVTYAKLAATSIAGAVNASTIQNGIVQLATGVQAASSTATGSTAAFLVIPASLATSSPGSNFTLGIPSTQNDGKLSPSFLNGTAENYTFNNLFTAAAGELSAASSTFTGTTTIAASSVTNKALNLNGLNYSFPSTHGASSTVLNENGNGSLTWEPVKQSSYINGLTNTTTATGSTTVASLILPAGSLSTTGSLKIYANLISIQTFSCTMISDLEIGNGTATTGIAYYTSPNPIDHYVQAWVTAQSASAETLEITIDGVTSKKTASFTNTGILYVSSVAQQSDGSARCSSGINGLEVDSSAQ